MREEYVIDFVFHFQMSSWVERRDFVASFARNWFPPINSRDRNDSAPTCVQRGENIMSS